MTTYGPRDKAAINQEFPNSPRQTLSAELSGTSRPADPLTGLPDLTFPPTAPAQPPRRSWRDVISLKGGSGPSHAAPPNTGYGDMDPKCSAYTQWSPRAQPRTSMVITSTWTLVGRRRSGWKCLAKATSRCKVASRSLLKMAGRRGDTDQNRGVAKAGAVSLRSQPPSEDQGALSVSSLLEGRGVETFILNPKQPALRMRPLGTRHCADGASDPVPADSCEQLDALQWGPHWRNCWILVSLT